MWQNCNTRLVDLRAKKKTLAIISMRSPDIDTMNYKLTVTRFWMIGIYIKLKKTNVSTHT